ncbi:UNVERIFIED_ORG: von Willebrand factor type A domain-containing protein [Martelella mediterranea]
MTRRRATVLALLCWFVLMVLTGALAYFSLKACGISLFGHTWQWCAVNQTREAETSKERIDILRREIATLSGRLAERPACTAPHAARLPPIDMPLPGAMPPTPDALAPEFATIPDLPHSKIEPNEQQPANIPDESPVPPEQEEVSVPAVCSTAEENRPPVSVVLALDQSQSMLFPSTLSSAEEQQLLAMTGLPTPAGQRARNRYDALIADPGYKRIDVLKDSIGNVVDDLNDNVEVGLVTFSGCDGVLDMGSYRARQRERMMTKINRLEPDSATPVAQALQVAIDKARHSGAKRIVLVSDGGETCGGDPCAIARNAGDIRIDVISMGGGRILSCVSDATGGTLTERSSTEDIELGLNDVIEEAEIESCTP